MAIAGLALLLTATLAVLKPRVVSIPLAILSTWIAIALLTKAIQLRRETRKRLKTRAPKR
jgi:hypothetical protein